MQTNKLKTYAPKARRDFIAAVIRRAGLSGLTANGIAPAREEGELVLIDGQPHPRRIGRQRARLAEQIRAQGFEQVMEATAYTWFNRLIAIRYMELHGFLDHSYRVLSPAAGSTGEAMMPEILDEAQHVELPGLDRERVIALKMDLADDIDAASSGAEAKRLQKERDKLGKQLDELRRFDEQLRHYADQRIKLDLDDGVKVNYGKFGDLLAEVKAVTGKSD